MLIFAILVFCVPNAQAQIQSPATAIGAVPYTNFQTNGIDNVNLSNGNVYVQAPLVSFPQLGGKLRLNFMIRYNRPQWSIIYDTTTLDSATGITHYSGHWVNFPYYVTSVVGATVTTGPIQIPTPLGVDVVRDQKLSTRFTDQIYGCTWGDCAITPAILGQSLPVATMEQVITPDGGAHPVALQGKYGPGNTLVLAADGSGYMPVPTVSGAGSATTFIGPDGITYDTTASTITDANGNSIIAGSSGWTDTIGRVIPGTSTGVGSTDEDDLTPGVPTSDLSGCNTGAVSARIWEVPSVNSSTATYKLCYSKVSYSTSFNLPVRLCNNALADYEASEASGTSVLLTQIVLPNSKSYTFSYDSFLDLESISLPTGGRIVYTYTTSAVSCTTPNYSRSTPFVRTVSTRTVYPYPVSLNSGSSSTTSETWSYQFSMWDAGSSSTTIVTDPLGNDEEIKSTYESTKVLVNDVTTYYQGSSLDNTSGTSTGTLLKTITKNYTGLLAPFYGDEILQGPISDSTTKYASGNTTKTVYTYVPSGGPVTYYEYGLASASTPTTYPSTTCQCINYGLPRSVAVYSYGTSGAAGNLLKTNTTTYAWENSSTYQAANLLSAPASVVVTDGAGNLAAETNYYYDQSNGSPSGVRENLTSVTRVNTSGTSATSQIVYNSLGMPTMSIDANGNKTYTSAFQCSGLFPQTVVSPYQSSTTTAETSTYSYDCSTGKLLSYTDPNNQTTSYTYSDSLARLTEKKLPDGGDILVSYNSDPTPPTVTVTSKINSSQSLVQVMSYDGLGRPVQTLTTSDPLGNGVSRYDL
jgi:YD repeat-containing protein